MSEPKYRDWILETIDSLRSRKARPDLERICRMLRRRHGSEPDRTRSELEKLIQEQTVLKVSYKGSISYRNAAKVQRKSRKKNEQETGKAANEVTKREISNDEDGALTRAEQGDSQCFDSGSDTLAECDEAHIFQSSGNDPQTCGSKTDNISPGRNESPTINNNESGLAAEAKGAQTGLSRHENCSSNERNKTRAAAKAGSNFRHRQRPQIKTKLRVGGNRTDSSGRNLGEKLVDSIGSLAERGRNVAAYRGQTSLGLKEILGILSSHERLSREKLTRSKVKVVLERGVAKGRLRRTRFGNVTLPLRGVGAKSSARHRKSALHERRITKQDKHEEEEAVSIATSIKDEEEEAVTMATSINDEEEEAATMQTSINDDDDEEDAVAMATSINEKGEAVAMATSLNEKGEAVAMATSLNEEEEAVAMETGRSEEDQAGMRMPGLSPAPTACQSHPSTPSGPVPECHPDGRFRGNDSAFAGPTVKPGLPRSTVQAAPGQEACSPKRFPAVCCLGAHRGAGETPVGLQVRAMCPSVQRGATEGEGAVRAEECAVTPDQLTSDPRTTLNRGMGGSPGGGQTSSVPTDAYSRFGMEEGVVSCLLTPTSSLDPGGIKDARMNQGIFVQLGLEPVQWSVADVASYITSAGFPEQAAAFRMQEVDGKSLLLMQRSDVLTGLSIRLGPALKIYEHHVKVLQRTHFEEDSSPLS